MKSCKNLSENNTYLKSENCKNIVVKHLREKTSSQDKH